MWNKTKAKPAKFVTISVLVIYFCLAVFLFTRLRGLNISDFARSFNKYEDAKKEAKKTTGNYYDAIIKEVYLNQKPIENSQTSYLIIEKTETFSYLMSLDGRLAIAPAIEPYFTIR